MLFGFISSKQPPKFQLGQVVERYSEHHPGCRYMMIRGMRFARSKGENEKQWVYSGTAIQVVAGRCGERDRILAITKIYDVLEKHLQTVEGLEAIQSE
jgi:hypothetical protein